MQVANKVAINTVVQYIRLVLNIVIALFSVRVVLNALGTSDYGVYDVIAGVIGLLGFINSSLSQTSIRYLSVSQGEKKIDKIRYTFNNSFWLHLFIALLLSIILELIGMFLFSGFLNIPLERIPAARIVYHLMVFTLFVQISITPFNALIISHEDFIYTSIVSIVDSLLKLAIAIALLYTGYDKLIVYASLMALVTCVNAALYILYIRIKYKREMYIRRPSISGIKSQSGFAGWTLLDVLGSVATRQGYSVVLNRFFGTTVNAVFALARQVEGQVYYISASVIDTMKPQIMKSYGANEKDRMYRLSMTAGKMGFCMMSLFTIPLLVFMPEILTIWLKNVPEGTVLFTRCLVIACMMEQLTRGIVYSCQAVGKIKWFSIIVSSIRFAALPVTVVLFMCGLPSYSAMFVFVACETIGSFSRVVVMSRIDSLDIGFFIKEVFLRILPSFIISLTVCIFLYSLVTHTLLRSLLIIIFVVLLYSFLVYFICLSSYEKESVKRIVIAFLNKVQK